MGTNDKSLGFLSLSGNFGSLIGATTSLSGCTNFRAFDVMFSICKNEDSRGGTLARALSPEAPSSTSMDMQAERCANGRSRSGKIASFAVMVVLLCF